MSQFSFEQKIEILSKMALDYCNENGLKFKQYNQKFAELIVKECIKQCNSRVGNSDYNTGRMHCASDIREHFGVE